ncbi:MAG: TetR/AcrR family transcriptional regulator [Bacteroidota bacterium]
MSDTAERLLDVAQALVQQRGFNAFSFRDLSRDLGITNAAIHYHYPTKASLGKALVSRYTRNFQAALVAIDQQEASAQERLAEFVKIYSSALRSGRFCLCGMLASDAITLPEDVLSEVRIFFSATEAWLAGVLEMGRASNTLHFELPATEEAQLVLATVEGAMLTAWPLRAADAIGAINQFEKIAGRMINTLGVQPAT